MTEILTVTPNWLEQPRPTKAEKLKAIREATAHCPCDTCVGWNMCKQTGHECAGYLRWVKTGTTKEVKTK